MNRKAVLYGPRELNAAMWMKLFACKKLLSFSRISGGGAPPLCGEERAWFIQTIGKRSRGDITAVQREACKVLLDYLAPGWMADDLDLADWLVNRSAAPGQQSWSQVVKERDGYKCRCCGSKEQLHAHHILPWLQAAELRFDVSNGVTLCYSCHVEQHRDMNRKIWAL